MTIRVRFRDEANADVIEALAWYRKRGLQLGEEFLSALDSCLAKVQSVPESHPVVHRDIRRALLRRFPYGIFYVYEGDVITVLACFHAKRDPATWKERARG
ncbi:type II toxin-antitoxin system RelE/ParE family toxin [Nitrospira sp. Nam80]